MVSRFFVPWLQLDQLVNSDPDKKFFPDYDPSLRDSFAKETELFLLSQLRDDRDQKRDIAPMIPAPDAIMLDSTQLTLEQVVERMEPPGLHDAASVRVNFCSE